MRIAIASDHAGLELRRTIGARLVTLGHEVVDFGPETEDSVDYPDYAEHVGLAVSSGSADRGVLVCGTGIGMQIAANKIHGVRAVAPYDEFTTRMSRAHNDSNVVCFGQRSQGEELVLELLELWLSTDFEGDRHSRRLRKIAAIEGHEPEDGER